MKARIIALRNRLSSLIPKKKFGTKKNEPFCDAHMNELPVPCYPWDPWYANKQSFYNKHLFVGVVSLILSIAAVFNSGMFWNIFPPKRPGPPSDMVDECDDAD